MNNESVYQKNKTNEPEINISLVLTTQKTPNSETTKAFQSQFLSLSWASTRKHNSVSLISLEVTKASPIASDVQFTTPKQKSKLSIVSLHTPKNESIYNSGPTTMHSPRMGSSRKSSILVNIQKLTTSIKDEINTKLIRATTANYYSSTNTIISTLKPVTMPNISKGTKIPNELLPETLPANSRKNGITNSIQNITVIMPIISSADNFISTLLSTTSQVLPGQDKITQRLTDSSTFKRQTTNTKEDIHQTSYRREFKTSPVYPITATSDTSTITVSPVIPSTTLNPDGMKKDQSTTSVLVATNMIENITSWLPLTSSITSNKDEIRNSITSISQSLNKDLETILTTMVQALLESTSERNSMPNKTNLTAKHEATLTHDTLTVAQQFVISPTSKKEMSTINLLVATVKNETIATKPLTFSITDELRKENTAALLTVTPDHNETNTTAAPNTLPATFISNGSTKTITTSHAKITLPVKSRTLITDVIKATFTAISSQSTSNKEEIRNEMNVSLVPVKTGIGDATTTVSYETATPTTYSITADIKNNHTGIPPLSSVTMVRNKTSKAILPVTSSTILDKETITTETNSTSLPLATASNNSMLPVTLVIFSITDRKTKKPTATSPPVIASMANGKFAKASASSTSDRITDTKSSSLLSFTLPTSSSKIKSMKFTASQPKSSINGITDEINFASQPDEEKNPLSTYGVNTKFPSATSPTILDTDELRASFTPVNLTLSQNHKGGGTATTVNPCISITMLCYALVCSFNDVTVIWNFDTIL